MKIFSYKSIALATICFGSLAMLSSSVESTGLAAIPAFITTTLGSIGVYVSWSTLGPLLVPYMMLKAAAILGLAQIAYEKGHSDAQIKRKLIPHYCTSGRCVRRFNARIRGRQPRQSRRYKRELSPVEEIDELLNQAIVHDLDQCTQNMVCTLSAIDPSYLTDIEKSLLEFFVRGSEMHHNGNAFSKFQTASMIGRNSSFQDVACRETYKQCKYSYQTMRMLINDPYISLDTLEQDPKQFVDHVHRIESDSKMA